MADNLSQQVLDFIRRHDFIQPGQHILVAVSGGADSVALLYVLRELKSQFHLRLTVAHLNHKIRGRAAEEDARFVKQLAHRLRLDFVLGSADVPRLAARQGISLEMAGRKARYDFFEKTARARDCGLVATAHTADDNAETVLLMLMRGCGLQGLAGIAPRSQIGKITVIRPLLGTERRTIERCLRARKIAWREDASNADPGFLRNRVRHELLPLLGKKYNRRIKETLNRMSAVLREENDFIESIAEKAYTDAASDPLRDNAVAGVGDPGPASAKPAAACPPVPERPWPTRAVGSGRRPGSSARVAQPSGPNLNWKNLAKYHIAVRRRVLRHWLLANNVKSATVDFQLINRVDNLIMWPGQSGVISLAGGLMVKKSCLCLIIECQLKKIIGNYRIKINIPGRTILPGAGIKVAADIGPGIWREMIKPGQFPARASLSLKAWRRRSIWARTWRSGDRMRPYRLDGSKKVQDIFSDAKFPAAMRRRWPIFECGREIVWIPGYRIAEGWQVSDSADNVLHLTVERIK